VSYADNEKRRDLKIYPGRNVTTSHKAAISLLIAVLLFGGFSFFAYGGLFDLLETRFYNPSVTAHLSRDITQNADAINKFFAETRERFSETLKTDEVRRSFLLYPSADLVSARSGIYKVLFESFYGVQWVRFIDADGKRLLFSSYGPDILNLDEAFPVYADYDEPDIPYEIIAVPEDGMPKYTFAEKSRRILFSFPLYDSFDIYWGTALFSISIDAVSARLMGEGRIKPGDEITLVANPAGLLFGMPASGENAVLSQVSSGWARLALSSRSWPAVQKTSLDPPPSEFPLLPEGNLDPIGPWRKVLLTARTSQGFFVGRLVNEEVFLFPAIMKIILLLAFFLTIYLIIFLLFNLRQDPLTVVQNRLMQLQISLIEQFYERKSEVDWARWIKELEHRREEIRALMKRGIKTGSGSDSGDMDILINKSWDELLSILGSQRSLSSPGETGIDEEKITSIIQKLLEARTGAPSSVSPQGKTGLLVKAASIADGVKNTKLAEEIEVLEELDNAEDLGIAESDVDVLASQIEFSPDIETEVADDELFNGTKSQGELEIVSPFSTMMFDFSPTDDADAGKESAKEVQLKEDSDNELNIDAAEGLPLITTPFSGISSSMVIETLEIFNGESQANGDGAIIREREGVHYISKDVLAPSPEFAATLNREFKELVDSVTK